jgi:anti-sigma regulatory factor (Ser/Thr protein kinase)
MAALNRFVDDAVSGGSAAAWSVGAIPLRDDGRDSRWLRYEGAVATVFAERPLRAVCLYDAHTTPLGIRDGVVRTHHSTKGDWTNGNGVVPAPAVMPLPGRDADLVMTSASPPEVRASIRRFFGESLSAESLGDLLFVASELVTNATVHGAPPVETRAWNEPSGCVLQVSDGGTSVIDQYADLRPCAGGAHGGFGLFTIGQIADSVDIDHHAHGNTVTVHLAAGH